MMAYLGCVKPQRDNTEIMLKHKKNIAFGYIATLKFSYLSAVQKKMATQMKFDINNR